MTYECTNKENKVVLPLHIMSINLVDTWCKEHAGTKFVCSTTFFVKPEVLSAQQWNWKVITGLQ